MSPGSAWPAWLWRSPPPAATICCCTDRRAQGHCDGAVHSKGDPVLPAQQQRPLRAAVYTRLSRDDDASTSIATQEADARSWCALRGYEVVLVAHDVGVSGSVRPEEREGFAEILAAAHGIDVVVARSVDRFSRSTGHFAALVETLDNTGTTLADVQGQADLTSPYGRFVVTLMVAFAQLERETIQGRILRSRIELRQAGKWLGGAAPYGFKVVPTGNGGKCLDLDPVAADTLRTVIDRVISGHTLSAEVERLNVAGVLSPGDLRKARRGELPPLAPGYAKWTYSALIQHLRSEVLRGYRVVGKRTERRVVRDDAGRPVMVGPPLVDDATWHALQATLKANGVETRRPRRKATLLLHVAWCEGCDAGMTYNAREYDGKRVDLYVCPAQRHKRTREEGPCPGTSVRADRLEPMTEAWLLQAFGRFPFTERVLVGGSDGGSKVAELQADVDELASSLVGLRGAAKAAVMRQLEARSEALEEALAEPVSAPRWEWVPTGKTVATEWAERDTAGRRLLLLSLNVRATVQPTGTRGKWDPERVDIDVHHDDPAAAEMDALRRDLIEMGEA
ncbi:recombinase family protein [Streptomyces maoxianensis]|uniref:Recombinase family protein n=1 Tax=Streptomyces maoxianensis TaxID=1459942 RepID=A0ABV9GCQ0_9ACTN